MLRSLFDDQNNYISFQLDFFKIFFIRLFSSSKRENNLLNSSEEPNKLDSVQLIVENLDIILKLLWAKTSTEKFKISPKRKRVQDNRKNDFHVKTTVFQNYKNNIRKREEKYEGS